MANNEPLYDLESNVVDFDPSKWIVADTQRATSAVMNSFDIKPKDAVEAGRLADVTGTDPSIVLGNLDNFKKAHKTALANEILNSNAYLRQFINDYPFSANVIHRDIGQLDEVTQKLRENSFIPGSGIAAAPSSIINETIQGFLKGWKREHDIGTGALRLPGGMEAWNRGGLPQAGIVVANLLGIPFELLDRAFTAATSAAHAGIKESYIQGGGSEQGAEHFAREITGLLEMQLMGLGVHRPGGAEIGADTIQGRKVLTKIAEAQGEPIDKRITIRDAQGTVYPPPTRAELMSSVSPEVLEQGNRLYEFIKVGKNPPIGISPAYDMLKAMEAEEAIKKFDELEKSVEATETKELDPEMVAGYIQGHTKDEIRLPAKVVRELYGEKTPTPDDNLFGWVPGIEERLALEEAAGGHIDIPLAGWLAKVDPELKKQLHDHIIVRKGSLSKKGIEAIKESVDKPSLPTLNSGDGPVDALRAQVNAEPMFDRERQRKLSLQRAEAKLDPGQHFFSILDSEGKDVGHITLRAKGEDLFIDWIGAKPEVVSEQGLLTRANAFGPRAVRDLLVQLRREFPEAKTIMGFRISGARQEAAAEKGRIAHDFAKIELNHPDPRSLENLAFYLNLASSDISLVPTKANFSPGPVILNKFTWTPIVTFKARDAIDMINLDQIAIGSIPRALYDFFGKRIKELAGDVDVHVVPNSEYAEGRPGSGAFYNAVKHAVVLPARAIDGSHGKFWGPEVLMHELAHAVTYRAILAEPKFYNAFDLLRKEADEYLTRELPEQRKYLDYGFTDAAEFVAEGWGNQDFQQTLSHVPMSKELAAKLGSLKGNTLWDAFRELISQLLERIIGRRPDPTILDGLLQLSSKFEDFHALYPELREPGVRGIVEKAGFEVAKTEPGAKAPPKEGEIKLPGKTPAAMGLTAKQHRLYERLINKKMFEDYEAGLGKAVKEETRSQTAEWKDNYREMAKEVERVIYARPDIAAWEWLRTGTLLGVRGPKITLSSQLLTKEQKAMLPDEFVRRTGKDPDAVAAELGYDSGRSMVERLGMLKQAQDAVGKTGRQFIETLIERETDRRMKEKYGDLDSNIFQEAKDRVINQTVLDTIAEDYLRLATEAKISQLPLDKAKIKEMVTNEFNKMKVKHIDSDEFFTNSGEHGNEATTQALLGEFSKSLKEKETQYYAAQRAQLAVKFEGELEKFEKLAKTYRPRGKPGQLVSGTAQEYTNMIHSILMRIGKEVDRLPEDLTTEMEKAGHPTLQAFINEKYNNRFGMDDMPIFDFVLNEKLSSKPIEEMSVDEFRQVHMALESLSKMGRAELKYLTEREAIARDDLIEQLKERVRTFPLKDYPLDYEKGVIKGTLKTFLAASTNLETLLNRFDRNDPYGVWNRYVVYPLAGAANNKEVLRKQFARIYADIGEYKDQNKKIDSPLIDPLKVTKENPEGAPFTNFTMGNVMVMIHNMGNESNWNVLAKGYGKDPEVLRQWVFNNSTKEMWDRAQKMGDMFKKVFEMAQREYRHIYGVAPEPIQLKPIETPFGTYDGWYHPLLKDPIRSRVKVDEEGNITVGKGSQAKESVYDNTDNSHIRTANGYTKARTGAIYPVDLNPDMIPIRLTQMIHDIAFRKVVIETEKLFRNEGLRQTITQHYGDHYTKGLTPYLEGVAGQEGIPSADWARVYNLSNYFRQNVISTYIGFNPFTPLKHGPTAWVMSWKEVGPAFWSKFAQVEGERIRAWTQRLYMSSEDIMRKNIDFADQTFEEISRRKRHWQDTIQGEHSYLYGKGTKRERMIEAGSWMVAGSDMISVRPTALAAYEKAIEEGASHGLAVDIANRAVRRAHGSTAITNLPRIVSGGGPVHSWLTSIYGFFGTIMQRRIEFAHILNDTYQLGKAKEIRSAAGNAPEILYRFMTHFVWPALVEEAVTGLTTDDRRGWGTHIISGVTHGLGASIIYLREWTHALTTGQDPGVGLISSPMHDASKLFRDLRHGEKVFSPQYAGKTVGDAITVLGHAKGISPKEFGNLARFGIDLLNDQAHPYDSEDWFMGLTRGTTKKRIER